jgi:S1-C subfamily serine protease
MDPVNPASDLPEKKTMGMELLEEEDAPGLRSGSATAEDWRKALGRVVSAVVVIKSTVTRSFDTESAGSIHATGFIVDKQLGIILTNRHVVKPGKSFLLLLLLLLNFFPLSARAEILLNCCIL